MRKHLRSITVGLLLVTLAGGGWLLKTRRETSFHPSEVTLLASTGRPQLVEFFHHQ